MRLTSLQTSALLIVAGAVGCGVPAAPEGSGGSAGAGGAATAGMATGGSGMPPLGGATTGGSANGGSGTGGGLAGGFPSGGSGTGGSPTGGSPSGGGGMGGSSTGGSPSGGSGMGGGPGGSTTGGMSGSGAVGGNTAGGGVGGSSGGGGSANGGATAEPDCNAQMPSGGQQRSGNGTGGEGNLAWEIWSNTGQGELTTYSVPAFIASWNNAGGYLGRLGYEWARFGDTPVPHTQLGTITAQFVSRKSGSAGGYSYVGMYGWTTNPCVEWYVVDDSYNTMPINPGNTTNEGERQIDGGTYIMYTRPTTGTGGTRCSNVTNWIQYYSVRRTARACGVISLTEHFNAWQSLGMDMTGELLEAKIIAEVGGGVGNVQLPVANVILQ